jgi:hypothetical protein
MNERIKQLAEQAGMGPMGIAFSSEIMQKFAELIVKECAKVAWYHTPDTEELEYSHLIGDKILKHFGVE